MIELEFATESEIPEALRPLVKQDQDGLFRVRVMEALGDEEIDAMVKRRYSANFKTHTKRIKDLEGQLRNLKTSLSEGAVARELSVAIAKRRGFAPSAVDDAMLLGRTLFAADQDGNVGVRDVGLPFESIDEWLDSTRDSKPHWWLISIGGSGMQPHMQGVSRAPGALTRAEAKDPERYRRAKEEGRGVVTLVD